MWFADVTLANHARIEGNTAARGGGVSNAPGDLLIRDGSTIAGNTATEGGGVWNDTGSVTLTNLATILDNTATRGAGIWNDEFAGVLLTGRSRVLANKGDLGGGLYNDHGTVRMRYLATVTANTASTAGGGIWTTGGLLDHVVAGVGGNVFANTPDDIHSQ